MSILVVHLVPEGLLFVADRNITHTLASQAGYKLVGQAQRPKVLKWPNRDVIIGYVGEAEVDGVATDEWLYAFIGRQINFSDFATLGVTLGQELDALMQAGRVQSPLIIHLGGFEQEGGEWTPHIWFVHNTAGLTDYGPTPGTKFVWTDEIPPYFPGMSGNEIRAEMQRRVARGEVHSFRQGYDLAAFNTIDYCIRGAMFTLVHGHPLKLHPQPTNLAEWAKHMRMSVLAYSAYFGAFYAPFEQYVGGGADVVHVPWP